MLVLLSLFVVLPRLLMNLKPKEHYSLESGTIILIILHEIISFDRAKMIKNKVEVNLELTAGNEWDDTHIHH